METINAIEVKGLWAAYEDRMIIEEMNLKIPKGNITIRYTKYGKPTSDTAIPAGISIGDRKSTRLNSSH